MTKKDFDYYVSLPYKVVIYPSPEGGYVVEIPELPGCLSQGDTVEEAMAMIEDAKRGWIDIALADGVEIPEPSDDEEAYSGKFVVRVPKSLHRDLVKKAKDENVSLNQLTTYLLSSGVVRSNFLKK
jgi:antitoxin HicB